MCIAIKIQLNIIFRWGQDSRSELPSLTQVQSSNSCIQLLTSLSRSAGRYAQLNTIKSHQRYCVCKNDTSKQVARCLSYVRKNDLGLPLLPFYNEFINKQMIFLFARTIYIIDSKLSCLDGPAYSRIEQ